ncbi:MAG: hypothetical protein IJ494_08040 [Bacteroides sp.]|nr:hypothetical protein [Bacteroides sp.]
MKLSCSENSAVIDELPQKKENDNHCCAASKNGNIWWKTAKHIKTFGGKRQNAKKHLVENGKEGIFVPNYERYERRCDSFQKKDI